ncbi:MAG: DUF3422 family protein, partial [Xanthobacteraceae bacterium]
MSAEVSIGEGGNARLKAHSLRAAVLGEVHARPFTPIETPRRVLHFAFDTTERGEADRAIPADRGVGNRAGLLPEIAERIMSDSIMYHEGNRRLQDQFDSRP